MLSFKSFLCFVVQIHMIGVQLHFFSSMDRQLASYHLLKIIFFQYSATPPLFWIISKHMCVVCFWALYSIQLVCSCVRTTCLYYCWFVIRLTSGRAGSPSLFFVNSVSTSFGLFHYYIHFKFRWSGYTHTPQIKLLLGLFWILRSIWELTLLQLLSLLICRRVYVFQTLISFSNVL